MLAAQTPVFLHLGPAQLEGAHEAVDDPAAHLIIAAAGVALVDGETAFRHLPLPLGQDLFVLKVGVAHIADGAGAKSKAVATRLHGVAHEIADDASVLDRLGELIVGPGEVIHAHGHVAVTFQDFRGQQKQIQTQLGAGQGFCGDAALMGQHLRQVGKAVDGHAVGGEFQGGFQRVAEGFHGLARQAVHQIQIHAAKTQLPRLLDGGQGLIPGLPAGDEFLHMFIQILHAEGDAVEAQLAQGRQLIGLEKGGIHFNGHFRARQQVEAIRDDAEGALKLRHLEVGWGAAAPVQLDGVAAVGQVLGPEFHFGFQRAQIGFHRRVLRADHHVAAAVRAPPLAKRNMGVERQGLGRFGIGLGQGRHGPFLGEVVLPHRGHGIARIARTGAVVVFDEFDEWQCHGIQSNNL